jgi:hypothetical protein
MIDMPYTLRDNASSSAVDILHDQTSALPGC